MPSSRSDLRALLDRLLPLETLPPLEPRRARRALAGDVSSGLEAAAAEALAQLERRDPSRRSATSVARRAGRDDFDVLAVAHPLPLERDGITAIARTALPRHAPATFAQVSRLLRLDDAAASDPRTGRARSGLLAQLDEAGRALLGEVTVRFHPREGDGEPPLDRALAAEALRRPEALLTCADATRVPRLSAEATRRGVRSLALAAVAPSGGEPLGHLEVHAAAANAFPAEALAKVALLADACSAALERTARVERLVFVDPLTAVYNRSYFDLQVENEMARAVRDGHSLALALVDIDDFKSFNTTFGYEAGNAVLVQVAAALRSAVRPFDTVARWGGEEFAVLLTAPVQAEDLRTICERLRTVVERQTVKLEGLDRTAHRVQVTVSIGVAMAPDHAASAPELFRSANRALLVAKRPPKNRVVYFDPGDDATDEPA